MTMPSQPPFRPATDIFTYVPPRSTESYPGQDVIRDLFEAGVDIDARKIYFIGDVERDLVDNAIRAIHLFNSPRMIATIDQPVEMIISSDGGDVHFMFALYDAIRLSKVPIHTVATGVVASAATMLLVAGADRRATTNTWYMHHQISSDITGNLDELTLRTKVTKQMAKVFYEILAKHSNKTARFWEQAARRKNELWLNSKEMLAHGVIDGIIEEEDNAKNV